MLCSLVAFWQRRAAVYHSLAPSRCRQAPRAPQQLAAQVQKQQHPLAGEQACVWLIFYSSSSSSHSSSSSSSSNSTHMCLAYLYSSSSSSSSNSTHTSIPRQVSRHVFGLFIYFYWIAMEIGSGSLAFLGA
jgi:hypothetical protein